MIIIFQRANVRAVIGQRNVAVFGFAAQGTSGTPPVTAVPQNLPFFATMGQLRGY